MINTPWPGRNLKDYAQRFTERDQFSPWTSTPCICAAGKAVNTGWVDFLIGFYNISYSKCFVKEVTRTAKKKKKAERMNFLLRSRNNIAAPFSFFTGIKWVFSDVFDKSIFQWDDLIEQKNRWGVLVPFKMKIYVLEYLEK